MTSLMENRVLETESTKRGGGRQNPERVNLSHDHSMGFQVEFTKDCTEKTVQALAAVR